VLQLNCVCHTAVWLCLLHQPRPGAVMQLPSPSLLPLLLVLCREEDATDPVHGHITSLAVARTHRKMGIAAKLMTATREANHCIKPLTPALTLNPRQPQTSTLRVFLS